MGHRFWVPLHYYNMKMIRRGVLTWGQSFDDARLMNALPATWKEVYNHVQPWLAALE